MPVVAGLRAPIVAVALALLLTGCVGGSPESVPVPSDTAPVGPVPAPSGPLALDQVYGIVSDADASATMSFTAGGGLSTSGDDLASENDYWTDSSGSPAKCAGVVSSPYLVSAHDTGPRLDDPSYLAGTFTEVDENRFGLIQVYERQFDDAATASDFFDEFIETVKGCPGYTLSSGGKVTLDVVKLAVSTIRDLPEGVSGLHYVETMKGGASKGVTIDFYRRDGVVVSVYGELTSSSTITQKQVDAISASVAQRLGVL